MSIGTNLTTIGDDSPQKPSTDAFKSSRSWVTSDSANHVFDTREANRLDLDENGWVKSLPSPEDSPQYDSVTTLMYREIPRGYEGGQYVVLYDGQGNINYSLDATKDTSASKLGRDVINVTPTDRGISLKITETDPSGTGDYIRNIRLNKSQVVSRKSQVSFSTFS